MIQPELIFLFIPPPYTILLEAKAVTFTNIHLGVSEGKTTRSVSYAESKGFIISPTSLETVGIILLHCLSLRDDDACFLYWFFASRL